ncbi:unnamed protein product, partial [Ranitomeya imitator]
MEQYVPCNSCASLPHHQEDEQDVKEPYYFNMEDCVLAAVDKDYLECPNHPEDPAPLQELVPEIFMTDFPSRLFLDIGGLEYSEENTNILGQGGSGTIIYKAVYKHKPVALKVFQIKKLRTSAEVIR